MLAMKPCGSACRVYGSPQSTSIYGWGSVLCSISRSSLSDGSASASTSRGPTKQDGGRERSLEVLPCKEWKYCDSQDTFAGRTEEDVAQQATGADGPPSRLFSPSAASSRVDRRSPAAFSLTASRLPIHQNPRHVLSSEWPVQCVNRGDGHGQTRQSHR